MLFHRLCACVAMGPGGGAYRGACGVHARVQMFSLANINTCRCYMQFAQNWSGTSSGSSNMHMASGACGAERVRA